MQSMADIKSSARNFFSFLNPVINYFTKPKEPDTNIAIKPIKTRRNVSSYSNNMTASLSLPNTVKQPKKLTSENSTNYITTALNYISRLIPLKQSINENDKIKNPLDDIPIDQRIMLLEKQIQETTDHNARSSLHLQKIELMEDQIKEHAYRRVELFFYLLVAVHGKQVIITKDHTVKQHGKGSSTIDTQGCHSSLFPNVKFEPIPSTWSSLKGMLKKNDAPFTLEGTHFIETLNMTVELPKLVNDFDGRLEGRLRPTKYMKHFLSILNKAAENKITPQQGMQKFFKQMQKFFLHFEKKYKSTTDEKYQAIKKIGEYQKEATFSAANDDMSMKQEHLNLLLRLRRIEKVFPLFFSKPFNRIQNEILTSKPVNLRNH